MPALRIYLNHCSKEPWIHVNEFEFKNLTINANAESVGIDFWLPFLYLTLVHSIEELNFYIFRITCLNNYDTVKKCSLVFLSVLLSISNDTNKKGEQTLTTAEFNERKKLKNTIEKTQRWNNSNRITGNMFWKPVSMKNSWDDIIKKAAKKVRERPKRPLMPRKHCPHPSTPSSSFKHQEQKLAL